MSGVKAVNRTLLSLLCTSIVAAFQPQLAAAEALSEDVPVPGGIAAFAHRLGIDPVPDRGRFVYEVIRLLYEGAEVRDPSAAAFLHTLRQPAPKGKRADVGRFPSPIEVVPVPLTAQIWGDAIFHRRLAPDELLSAIVADRQAALLCHGLATLDDRTLEYFVEHASLLTRLYERSAPSFAAFAESLRISRNHVVPDGGEDAVVLWEAVINQRVSRPDRFVAALFELYDGRLAYLYDTIGQLDPPRRAFVLGAWMPNLASRLERFKALTTAALGASREWHIRVLPFGRQPYDLTMALMRLEVDRNGVPSPPHSLALWSRVFGAAGLPESGREGARDGRRPAGEEGGREGPRAEGQIDAAWLAGALGASDVRSRAERLDQIGFAQRVFKGEGVGRSEMAFVLRALPRFRALLLSLERMGVRDPDIYVSAVRHASQLSSLEGRRGFLAQAQLQGALALLARMTRVGTLEAASSERLLKKLFAISLTADGRYAGAIARWLVVDLRPALPAARDAERALIAGLAGPSVDPNTLRRITWEGQQYRLDFAAAERRRLERVRERQEGLAIDVPLQLAAVRETLAAEAVSLDDLQDGMLQLTTLASDIPQRSKEEDADQVPPGVAASQGPHETLRKSIDELTRAIKSHDRKRLPRLSEPLMALEDEMLARTLLSFAYAVDLGDPDGTALLAGDVSHRHDFGFGLKDPEVRARVAWSIPRQEIAPGVPWHVRGSLLGLDVALASLALRRVSADRIFAAPKLTSNAREAFAISVSLLDPLALNDADRDALAGAIDRGHRRVLDATNEAAIDAVADELSIDGARRRALQWTRAHESERLPSMLSLAELLMLGGAPSRDLDAWGMSALTTSGCLCSRLLPPARWPALAGRPSLGLSASVMPDLTFQVALVLKQLGLPSSLTKVTLSTAMQDFIDEVKPTDDGDWLTLSRAARALTRERIEDYVAAATASGPLVPDMIGTPRQ